MNNKNYPPRVLHVFSKLNRGGAESMIMNLYRNIDRDKIQFDFLCLSPGEFDFTNEIRSLGGRIFTVNTSVKKSPLVSILKIVEIIKKSGPFVAVHAHSLPSLIVTISRLLGINRRISHVHSTYSEKKMNLFRKTYMGISRKLIWINATNLAACSQAAGIYFYGKGFEQSVKCNVIPNAIDIRPYLNLNKEDLKEIKELGISENTIVLGHIGSYRPVKNHDFLIKFASFLKNNNVEFKMLLVGNGNLFKEIKNSVRENDLENEVLLLGIRSDVPALLNLFDVLLMPSLFEGIPVTVVEAQAAGTPCVISNNITREVDMGCGLVEYVNIKDDYNVWLNSMKQSLNKKIDKKTIFECINKRGYDVSDSKKIIYKLYNLDD
ncbi:glycosyltransferase family 1 protein [Bacillus sp. MM2020_1]|nr:glycosyltransferase family 1 protein [Bacillus sp. MM2020_1]